MSKLCVPMYSNVIRSRMVPVAVFGVLRGRCDATPRDLCPRVRRAVTRSDRDRVQKPAKAAHVRHVQGECVRVSLVHDRVVTGKRSA